MKKVLLVSAAVLALTVVQGQTKSPQAIMSPSLAVTMSPDVTICNGQSTTITAICTNDPGPFSYVWSPAGSLNNPNISNPVASPTTTIIYSCYLSNGASATTGTVTVTVNSCAGILQINMETEFSISPNPFSTQATLQTNTPLHNATLTVYNCYGQEVTQSVIPSGARNLTITRDGLPCGIYFYKVTEDKGQGTSEVITTGKLIITDK
ncbi:MAG: T9SS type A sorting domain-containing protein [Bacteroidetes bacterium]|nr:T9SS type A sorting domain-containing protein [Bacteroidota bacterium]